MKRIPMLLSITALCISGCGHETLDPNAPLEPQLAAVAMILTKRISDLEEQSDEQSKKIEELEDRVTSLEEKLHISN